MVVSSAGWGGGERAALSLAADLSRAGEEVLVAGRGGGLFEQETAARGLRFAPACPGDGPDLRGVARLLRLIRAERPDVVHAHLNRAALWSGIAARIARVPLVSTAHGITRAIYYRMSHRVICVSHAVAAHLVAQVADLSVHVIVNALDPATRADPARAAVLRRELVPDPAERLLLIAAKLHPNKGQRLAIEALAQVPRCRLALAGDGPDQAHLATLAARAGVAGRVSFLGHRSDVLDLMGAADALLVPSEHEAFSLAAAEALLCGTPVIAARTGGLPEVVGADGVLLDARDPAAWAAAVTAVLADLPAARARAAAAGPRLLSTCAPAPVLAATRAVYAALVNVPAPARR